MRQSCAKSRCCRTKKQAEERELVRIKALVAQEGAGAADRGAPGRSVRYKAKAEEKKEAEELP